MIYETGFGQATASEVTAYIGRKVMVKLTDGKTFGPLILQGLSSNVAGEQTAVFKDAQNKTFNYTLSMISSIFEQEVESPVVYVQPEYYPDYYPGYYGGRGGHHGGHHRHHHKGLDATTSSGGATILPIRNTVIPAKILGLPSWVVGLGALAAVLYGLKVVKPV